MAEIIPDIYQLKVPIPFNPLEYTNVYLLKGNDGYLLIDAGVNTPEALQSVKRQLAEIRVNFKDISHIIITHVHGDHYGLAGKLKELSQAKLAFHQLEKNMIYPAYGNAIEFFRQGDQWLQSNGVPTRELPLPQPTLSGMQRFSPPALPDITFQGGETLSAGGLSLQVVWTPGHSPGHICLYDTQRKVFFSGDHILPVITPNISLRLPSAGNPLGDFIQSLNKVKALDVNLVLPAHEQIFYNLSTRVEEIIEHHQHRNQEILDTLETRPKTAYEISAEITWMPELGGVKFHDLAVWDRRMAVSETLAHLEALRRDGVISQFPRDGITYYRLGKE
jgi:glyoxylase-like metal-dependent hydrolase (beta-lactamase superfamily II)